MSEIKELSLVKWVTVEEAGSLVSITFDSSGNVYLLDQKYSLVHVLDSQGKPQKIFGEKGEGPGEFMKPYCITTNSKVILVYDLDRKTISRFNMNTEFLDSFPVHRPVSDIALLDDSLFLSFYTMEDKPSLSISELSSGVPITQITLGNEISLSEYIKFDIDHQGNLYIGRLDKYLLDIYSKNGEQKRTFNAPYHPSDRVEFKPFNKVFNISCIVEIAYWDDKLVILYGGNQDVYRQVKKDATLDPRYHSRIDVLDLETNKITSYWHPDLDVIMYGLFDSPVFEVDTSGNLWAQPLNDSSIIGVFDLFSHQ